MNRLISIFSGLLVVIFLAACSGGATPSPKPRGYPRVDFPERNYVRFDSSFCDFVFEYPDYMEVEPDTDFFGEAPAHPCWFNLYYPGFDSRVHMSYYPVGEEKSLSTLVNDAFELVDWHKKRANYIEEIRIERPGQRVYGFAFEIEGPAASGYQFFLTDSTAHFLRGALYFDTEARPDSLAPVTRFVETDIVHLLETFRWTD